MIRHLVLSYSQGRGIDHTLSLLLSKLLVIFPSRLNKWWWCYSRRRLIPFLIPWSAYVRRYGRRCLICLESTAVIILAEQDSVTI